MRGFEMNFGAAAFAERRFRGRPDSQDEMSRPGGHHRGGGRVFGHGDIRFVLLGLLSEKPAHGYELIRAIDEKLNGAYSPSPGLIYPTLTMLEETGFVTSAESDGNRRLYSITPEGRTLLDINKSTLRRIEDRMKLATERHRRNADPGIVAAMDELKLALRNQTADVLTNPQTDQICRVIREAAEKIAALKPVSAAKAEESEAGK